MTWHVVWQIPYLAVAAGFAILTFREGDRKGGRWDAFRVAGLMLSLVWPAVLLGFYLHSLKVRSAKAAYPKLLFPAQFKSALSK